MLFTMAVNAECLVEIAKRIKALSDTGLVYAQDEYDRERYAELHDLSLTLLSNAAGLPQEVLREFYMPIADYPTPKVDIRGLVLNESGEVLLVKEKIDGRWSLPGGWGDVGFSPSEVVVKEMQEETGLNVKAVKVLALYDKRCHPHPPQPFYVYKIVFLCEKESGELSVAFDIDDVGYFSIDCLPEISEDRILASQIRELHKLAMIGDAATIFD